MNTEKMIQFCKPYSMAFSGGRSRFLWEAVEQIEQLGLPGDLVECGVYKGGCCMLMAYGLGENKKGRKIWMYDTFEGMPQPGPKDIFHTGKHAKDIWRPGWCEGTRDEVLTNMESIGFTGYVAVKGKVEKSIPHSKPESIALLRLDTDFYSSTKHELTHLYPLLSPGGFLIIDDYFSWQGSREACNEYFDFSGEFERIGKSNAAYLIK